MYISGFSDEIDKNIDIQFSVLNKLGIKYFEPRGIDGKNISLLSLDEAKKLKVKMDKENIKASSIGSPIALGVEGVKGLTISNAIHLSSWTGKEIDINNFPHDEFHEILKEKIKNSKADQKNVREQKSDLSNTFNN